MSSSSSPIELTILSVEPQDSYVQDQVRHSVWPSEGLFAYLYVQHAASHVYERKRGWLSFYVKFQLSQSPRLMYIYKTFWVYFHLSSDTGPNIFFLYGGLPVLNLFFCCSFFFFFKLLWGESWGILSF